MKNNQITIALILSLIIGGSILGYGYLNNKYKTEALEKREAKFEKCKKEAEDKAESVWNKHCTSIGKSHSCSLPSSVAKVYKDSKQKAIDNCVRLYSAD